ncbi:MAG: ATP-dependent helicase [Candidatus Didemnitutus sp.]|nr:ATP-dependent helicase [Candidatus Didemnitutus sp.]
MDHYATRGGCLTPLPNHPFSSTSKHESSRLPPRRSPHQSHHGRHEACREARRVHSPSNWHQTLPRARRETGDRAPVTGAADNQFPTRSSIEDGDVEEERRLFYVAVTRAKNELYISHPRVATRAGPGGMMLQQSRILTELPNNLYDELRIKRSWGW